MPERNSTRLAFFIAGLALATWAPLVPFAKTRLDINEGLLGLLLLGLGAGSLIAMPIAGLLTARYGCRIVITASTLLLGAQIPLLAWLESYPLLLGALMLFGAGVGGLEVSMNTQAVLVERDAERPLMSGFHGMFSVGGMAGAASMALLLGASWTPLEAAWLMLALAGGCLALAYRHLLTRGGRGAGKQFAIPHGRVIALGLVCFVIFLAEGAVLDWGAVFLVEEHAVEASRAGWGYAAFALTMTMGRLQGDRVVARLGPGPVITVGCLAAAAGFALAIFGTNWLVALAGFALIGAGCANIAPVIFSAAGRQQDMPESTAIPAITTLGYAGILAGPAGIGLVSHFSSMAVAFLLVALLVAAMAISPRFLRLGP